MIKTLLVFLHTIYELQISFFFEMNERMKLDPNLETIENSAVYDQLTLESVDFFVRMMSIMGLPRSVGEIYGLLYFSPSPLSMDQICTKLEISVGSASQGLKTLRSLKSVKSVYVSGERKDYFLARNRIPPTLLQFYKGNPTSSRQCIGEN